VPHILVCMHHALVERVPTLQAGCIVQKVEAMAGVAGPGVATYQPGMELWVDDVEGGQLLGGQCGVYSFGAVQTSEEGSQLSIRYAEGQLCRRAGRCCLGFFHTVGAQEGLLRLPCGVHALGTLWVGRDWVQVRVFLGRGGGCELQVRGEGPRSPRAAGLGGQQVGTDLSCGVRGSCVSMGSGGSHLLYLGLHLLSSKMEINTQCPVAYRE
jgi:hypothetical protein